MALTLLIAAALAAPLEFLAADNPLVLGRLEPDRVPVLKLSQMARDLELDDGCLEAPLVYFGAVSVVADSRGLSTLSRCYWPGITLAQAATMPDMLRTADGCLIERTAKSTNYVCDGEGGVYLLHVEGPGAADDAWLAERFAHRAPRTLTASELTFDAWTGPFALWIRFKDAPRTALIFGEVKVAAAIQHASPEQVTLLWRAGQQELGSAILAMNPSWLETSAATLGFDAAGQLAGLADLTAHGEQVWSHLRPVKLPKWTGIAPLFALELGADLAAMSAAVRQPDIDPKTLPERQRECGMVCALTRLLGSPVMSASLVPKLSIYHGALGLGVLGLPGERRAQGQMVLGAADSAAADALLATLKAEIGEDGSYSRFGDFATAGEVPSAWAGKRRVPAGLHLSLSAPLNDRRTKVDKDLLAYLFSMSPGGELTIDLVADLRRHVLLAGSNGASPTVPRKAARAAAALGNAAAWSCIMDLTLSDPLSRPIHWEAPWLSVDTSAQVDQALARATECRDADPALAPLLQRREVAYLTLLGIYAMENADFSGARAAFERACAGGESLGCRLLDSLPVGEFTAEDLPKVNGEGWTTPIAAPAVVLGRGEAVAGSTRCALTDVGCVGALHQGQVPLIYTLPNAKVGDLAALLATTRVGWLAASDGEHLVARRIELASGSGAGDAQSLDRELELAAGMLGSLADEDAPFGFRSSEPIATLLAVNPDQGAIRFALIAP